MYENKIFKQINIIIYEIMKHNKFKNLVQDIE